MTGDKNARDDIKDMIAAQLAPLVGQISDMMGRIDKMNNDNMNNLQGEATRRIDAVLREAGVADPEYRRKLRQRVMAEFDKAHREQDGL